MTQITESGFRFTFPEGYEAVKFDDTSFYRRYFSFPGSKGLDIIACSAERIVLLEIKNCVRDIAGNRWRIAPDNQKVNTISTQHEVHDRDSVDIEMIKKTAMTLACMVGAFTKKEGCPATEAIVPVYSALVDEKVCSYHRKVIVVLFLEGEFGSAVRPTSAILRLLQTSMNNKLK